MVIIALAYAVSHCWTYFTARSSIIYYDEHDRTDLFIEFSGDAKNSGIYSMPTGTTAADFLRRLGIKYEELTDRGVSRGQLRNGDKLSLCLNKEERYVVKHDRMSNVKCIMLDIPVDLNDATAGDLMLVPGIGERTAAAIIRQREKLGRFVSIEYIKNVCGLGDKRLAEIKKNFYTNPQSLP